MSFTDFGTCGAWATFTDSSTYFVGALNNDGTYNVKLRMAGGFVTIDGSSPSACYPSGNNGNTLINGIKGHDRVFIYIVVSGGTFDPNATCDSTCAENYSGSGIGNFVAAFFGGSATWSYSTVRDLSETASSHNVLLCANHWTVTQNLQTFQITSSVGDIATHCS